VTNRRLRPSAAFLAVVVASLSLPACAGGAANVTPSPSPTIALPTARPTTTTRPTPTLAPATVPPPSQPVVTPTPVVYVVQAGDTLIPIANKYGVSVSDLIAANNNLDPTRLQVGQQLIIPVAPPAAVAADGSLLASPTPLPYQIRGLNVVRTPVGSIELLGETFNPAPTAVGNVKLLVSLLDDTGNVLQSAVAFVARDVIPQNQTSPFRVLFTDPPAGFSRYDIVPLRGEAVDPSASSVRLQVTRVQGTPDGTKFRVNGEAKNAGGETANKVRLLVTTYDGDKRVIGYRYFTLSETPLAPNASLLFDVVMSSASPNVASFAVTAEGLK
jgi:LysM repeat protein